MYKASPEEVKLLMIDPKVVELGGYNGIPHLLVPVVTDPKKAAGALCWAVGEMLNRYKLFAATGTRDLEGYNRLAAEREELHPMPQIVIIIDELADLMMAAPKDVEDYICRLAQMARAAGMHLVIATQRPSVDVITGLIKANIPSRISFAVSSQIDSRTILDMGGAEKLLGRGDMLYYPVGSNKPTRVQGCFVTDSEVERVVTFIKQGETGEYDDQIMTEIEQSAAQVKGKGGSSGSVSGAGESDPEGEGVTINGTHYKSWHDAHEELGHDLKGKSDFRRRWDAFPFPALVLVAYLAVGWATGQWVVALLLGYLVPLYYMVGAALGGEEPFSVVSGAWPLLATAYYVWQGIFFDRWGSAWLVFPTIPLVCIAFDSLDKWWRHRK